VSEVVAVADVGTLVDAQERRQTTKIFDLSTGIRLPLG
jgi:hypothetical protein